MDEARRPDPAEGVQRLDMVFVHLKRAKPIVGEVIKKGKGELGLHVIYGPPNKVGTMMKVPTNALQSYKVTSHQLKGAFPNNDMPQELVEKGEAYLITDKPTMYPDFSGYTPNAQAQAPVTDQGGMMTRDDLKAMAPKQQAQPAQQADPNVNLAQDILKAGKGGEDQGFPMTFGLRRRYGNAGV